MAYEYRYKPKRHVTSPFSSKLNYKMVAAVALIVIAAVYFLLSKPVLQPDITITTTTIAAATTIPPSTGKLIVAAKDVKQKLGGFGYATALNITVKSIQVHTTGDDTEDSNITAAGWITVFEKTKTFDLIEYTDVLAIIGDKDLDVGKYTQVRLYISDATIKIYNLNYSKQYPMNIPNNVLKLVHPFTIEANQTTVLTLDFDVPSSVPLKESIVGIGITYRFSPVVKVTDSKIDKDAWPDKSTII